ncbi:MAG: signal recognition particle subunit SRP19/SEC65 family protein [Candidatus Hodarchaeales archaeon]
MRRDNTHYFVYPEYLDKSLKRSEGRRLPLDCSLDNPTWQEIRLAAEKLGLGWELRKDGGYSRQWWNPKGLVLVEKKKSKLSTLREISIEIEKSIRLVEKKKSKLSTLREISIEIEKSIRPALEKKKKELAKEKKKRKIKTTRTRKGKKTEADFRPKRRR